MAMIVLTIVLASTNSLEDFSSWLSYGESGSATLRNVGLLVLAIIGLPFAIWRTIVAARQAAISRYSLRNERHQKAVEMLGHSVLAVRLGGIYGLQQLAKEDPICYHIQVMSLFCAFLRHPTTLQGTNVAHDRKDPSNDRCNSHPEMHVRRDVLEALRAIGTRDRREIEIERRAGFELVIDGADFRTLKMYEVNSFTYDVRSFRLVDSRPKRRANLSHIHFRHVNFLESNLSFVDMSNAEFWDPDLTNAVLESANLSETSWEGGTLRNARVSSADLSRAIILETSFANVDLSSSDLSGVVFQEVDLSNTNLDNANISGTCFSLIKHDNALISREGAKRFRAESDDFYIGVRGLTQAQIDQAWANQMNPPQIEGVVDANTGKPLVWRGKSVPA